MTWRDRRQRPPKTTELRPKQGRPTRSAARFPSERTRYPWRAAFHSVPIELAQQCFIQSERGYEEDGGLCRPVSGTSSNKAWQFSWYWRFSVMEGRGWYRPFSQVGHILHLKFVSWHSHAARLPSNLSHTCPHFSQYGPCINRQTRSADDNHLHWLPHFLSVRLEARHPPHISRHPPPPPSPCPLHLPIQNHPLHQTGNPIGATGQNNSFPNSKKFKSKRIDATFGSSLHWRFGCSPGGSVKSV